MVSVAPVKPRLRPYRYLYPLVVTLPGLLWILANERAWTWDEADYGRNSIDLIVTLLNNPSRWFDAMTHVSLIKAPMIVWIGQFFVLVGTALSSIDTGLLLFIVLTQFLSLFYFFRILEDIFDNVLISAVGCLMVASSPIFFLHSVSLFVEPLQLLSVVWFLHIMVHARKWDGPFTLLHLVAASSFAILVKSSSPLYCVGPGLVAICYALADMRKFDRLRSVKYTISHVLISCTALFLATCAVMWYWINLASVLAHANFSATSELWGATDTVFNKLMFWLLAIEENLFIPYFVLIPVLLLLCASGLYFSGRRVNPTTNLVVMVSVLQIMLFLTVLSSFNNEVTRFLLPLLPYFALLICWCVAQIDSRRVSLLTLSAFVTQLIAASACFHGFMDIPGFVDYRRPGEYKLASMSRNDFWARGIVEVVNVTCSDATVGQVNVVGSILLGFDSENMSFMTRKRHFPDIVPCDYTWLGRIDSDYYIQPDVDGLLETIISLKPTYFVAAQPDQISKEIAHLETLNEITPFLLKKIDCSSLFVRIPLSEFPEIFLYRFVGEESEVLSKILLNDVIRFGEDGRGDEITLAGFSESERHLTWTNGPVAVLRMNVPAEEGNLEMTMRAIPFAPAALGTDQFVSVFWNGRRIARWVLEESEAKAYSAFIDHSLIEDGETADVVFVFSERRSPEKLGLSHDRRLLGLALVDMVIGKARFEGRE